MQRLIIDEKTNTLIKCKHHMYGERLDYLIIWHQYNEKQIDCIGTHCFDTVNLLCIEEKGNLLKPLETGKTFTSFMFCFTDFSQQFQPY